MAENWQWSGLWLILIITAIYSRPLIPIDETRYLSVAWEMWQSHNFLVPHINGEPYSHKPPLLFWCIHLLWLLFGVGEWSGRFVGPLFGFASVLMMVRLAKLLWPDKRDIRLAVPFVLLATVVWSVYSSFTMFDTLLTFLSLSALTSLLMAGKRASFLPWLAFSAATGLGILAKGPIILLYVLPPALLVPLWRRGESLSWKRWYGTLFLALAGAVAIALCWAIPAGKAGGEEYSQAIFFGQTAGRMVKSFAHGRSFYWYMLLLPLLCFPWFFWLPVWRGGKNLTLDNSTRFCLTVIVPALVLLSFVSGKQVHYILPVLPLAALLTARIGTSVSRRSPFDHLPLISVFLVAACILFVVPLLSFSGEGDRAMLEYIPAWIGLVPLGCGVFLYRFRSLSGLGSIKAVSVSVLLLVIFLHLAMAAPLHLIYDQSEIAIQMKKVEDQGKKMAIFPAALADQFQFAGRLTKPLIPFDDGYIDKMVAWSKANPRQFCLIFIHDEEYKLIKGSGFIRRYSNGWLLLRQARGLFSHHRQVFPSSFPDSLAAGDLEK